jgi:hypothetical protein
MSKLRNPENAARVCALIAEGRSAIAEWAGNWRRGYSDADAAFAASLIVGPHDPCSMVAVTRRELRALAKVVEGVANARFCSG